MSRHTRVKSDRQKKKRHPGDLIAKKRKRVIEDAQHHGWRRFGVKLRTY